MSHTCTGFNEKSSISVWIRPSESTRSTLGSDLIGDVTSVTPPV